MKRLSPLKVLLALSSVLGVFGLIGLFPFSFASGLAAPKAVAPSAMQGAGEYAGFESCQECHEDEYMNFMGTSHSRMTESSHVTGMERACEACHGPAKLHVDCQKLKKQAREMGQEEPSCDAKAVSFTGMSPKDSSNTCLECHAGRGEEHGNFRRGEHWRNDVGCVDCHDPHGTPLKMDRVGSPTFVGTATRNKIDWGVRAMLKESEPQLCLKCHNEVRPQFSKPFHHEVLEGAMTCSDCHNPHGGFELKQARLASGTDQVCVKCHTDKQGPFAFEHAPLRTEGCAACHEPHGSSNPRMLRRPSTFQLCLECHSDALGIGAPNTPSFHNIADEKWRNCTVCHVKIHGSMSHPVFFR